MITAYFIFNILHTIMAQKSNPKKYDKVRFWKDMKKETIQAVFAILFFVLTLLSILSAFHNSFGHDIAGPFGQFFYSIMYKLLGIGYFLLPLFSLLIAIEFLKGMKKDFEMAKAVGGTLFFISALGLIELVTRHTDGTHSGGFLGYLIATPLIKLFDIYATMTLLIAFLAISTLIIFETHFTLESLMFWKHFKKNQLTPEEAAAAKEKRALRDEDEKIQKLMQRQPEIKKALKPRKLAQPKIANRSKKASLSNSQMKKRVPSLHIQAVIA
jgi:hypothetical protein